MNNRSLHDGGQRPNHAAGHEGQIHEQPEQREVHMGDLTGIERVVWLCAIQNDSCDLQMPNTILHFFCMTKTGTSRPNFGG